MAIYSIFRMCYIIGLAVIGTFINGCSTVRIQYIENQVDEINNRLDLEAKTRQKIDELFITKLEKFEEKLRQAENSTGNDTVVATSVHDQEILARKLKKMNDVLKHLFNAFKDEKSVNSKMRRSVPYIENILAQYGPKTDTIINYVINTSQEFTDVKTSLNEILKLLKSDYTLVSNIDNSVSDLTVNVNTALQMIERQNELHLSGIKNDIIKLNRKVEAFNKLESEKASSCLELYYQGHRTSGVYDVNLFVPYKLDTVSVYCDQETDGGGWTVFQRRKDGSEDFKRGWFHYKFGFGNLDGEFWLGNEHLHGMTEFSANELRIDMTDFENNHRYAKYNIFQIGSSRDAFSILVSGYSGDAGDSFSDLSGRKFTTKDKDHDTNPSGNCATVYKGGWWYSSCHNSNLNGLYLNGSHTSFADGVNWKAWRGYHYSLKHVEMKFRSVL